MSNRDTRAPRTAAISGAEEPEYLHRWSRQNPSNHRQTGCAGMDAEECPGLQTEGEKVCDAPFHVCADRVAAEERSMNTETDPVTIGTSDQLLVYNAVSGAPVPVEDASNIWLLEKLTTHVQDVKYRVLTALETLLLHTVHKVVHSPEFIGQFSDTVMNNPELITSVATLVRSEQQKLGDEQAKTEK